MVDADLALTTVETSPHLSTKWGACRRQYHETLSRFTLIVVVSFSFSPPLFFACKIVKSGIVPLWKIGWAFVYIGICQGGVVHQPHISHVRPGWEDLPFLFRGIYGII